MVKSAVADTPTPEEKEMYSGAQDDLHITEELEEELALPPEPSVNISKFQKPNTDEQPEQQMPGIPSITEKPSTMQGLPSITEKPRVVQKLPSMTAAPKITREMSMSSTRETMPKHNEPIFIRIDKFQSAHKNFGEIKDKVEEIESVLKKIKDVRLHEETELKGWTEDIKKVKSRLAEIDTNIFDQI